MNSGDIPLLDERILSYLLVDTEWQVSVLDEVDSTQNYLKSKNNINIYIFTGTHNHKSVI